VSWTRIPLRDDRSSPWAVKVAQLLVVSYSAAAERNKSASRCLVRSSVLKWHLVLSYRSLKWRQRAEKQQSIQGKLEWQIGVDLTMYTHNNSNKHKNYAEIPWNKNVVVNYSFCFNDCILVNKWYGLWGKTFIFLSDPLPSHLLSIKQAPSLSTNKRSFTFERSEGSIQKPHYLRSVHISRGTLWSRLALYYDLQDVRQDMKMK
jgi:hypothetical protein